MLRCVFILLSIFFSLSSMAEDKKSDLVLIALDGIGYDTLTEMYSGGYFRNFQRPIQMIATFPSISDPNWAQLINAPIEEGYTKAHFNPNYKDKNGVGQEVGSVLKHLTAPPAYEKKFDYKADDFIEHVAGVALMRESAEYRIDDLQKSLLEKSKPKHLSTAFIFSTDLLSHTEGKQSIIRYLKKLDKKLLNLRSEYLKKFNRTLDFIIVSDHGNFFTKPKHIDFKKTLEKNNWFWKPSLNKTNEYAFVAPEIISFGAFYTLPGSEQKFALDISKVAGVHTALALEKENVIRVYNKGVNITEIEIDPKKETVSYKVIQGHDPFEQIQLFKNKKMTWDEYFEKTLKTDYPNALVNAWEGFYKNARMPASVLVSAELGYVFTNLALEILTALSGINSTHGSFHKKETCGVFMSTIDYNRDSIRPKDLRGLLPQ